MMLEIITFLQTHKVALNIVTSIVKMFGGLATNYGISRLANTATAKSSRRGYIIQFAPLLSMTEYKIIKVRIANLSTRGKVSIKQRTAVMYNKENNRQGEILSISGWKGELGTAENAHKFVTYTIPLTDKALIQLQHGYELKISINAQWYAGGGYQDTFEMIYDVFSQTKLFPYKKENTFDFDTQYKPNYNEGCEQYKQDFAKYLDI